MTPNVYFLELPSRVKGYVCKNEDDTHTIILNSRLSLEQNMKTFLHELSHIENNDFEKPTVNEAEG
jgi:Zn-dependent peptidase ImmA (M78 family)